VAGKEPRAGGIIGTCISGRSTYAARPARLLRALPHPHARSSVRERGNGGKGVRANVFMTAK